MLTLLHRWQSHVRCRAFNLHDHHCTHPVTEGWWIMQWAADPESTFAGYQPPETMPRHAAPRQSLIERIKAWWKRVTGC